MRTRFLIGWLVAAAGVNLLAETGDYPVSDWSGTAYVEGGWFVYAVKPAVEGGAAVKLDNLTSFLLSPRYPAPIRAVALKVKCNTATPTRHLAVGALVDGIESEAETILIDSVAAAQEYEIVKLTWDASRNVTALRVHLQSAGSPAAGEWTLAHFYVFYGDAAEDEMSVIEKIVNPLAVPENLTASDFSSTSLTLTADAVANAASYCFSLTPFTVEGGFEHVETFADAPDMSAGSGWTQQAAEGVSFGSYAAAATSDGDKAAIKLGKEDVDFLSPLCQDPITEYSFMYRNGTSAVEGKSNRLAVYGRTGEEAAWTELLAPFAFVEDTAKHHLTNRLDAARGIRQVKISYFAGETPSETISLDTLRVANERVKTYGMPMVREETACRCEWSGLPQGRYAFKVQARPDPANERYAPSDWSAEREIDLAWAALELSAPQGVTAVPDGARLKITWEAVEKAEYYLVDVSVPGYPPVSIVQGQRETGTSATVAVPELGEYDVAVTACGPFGKAVSAAGAVKADVALGRVAGLKVTELTPVSLAVAWDEVAFAEGYQVTLLALSGEAAVYESDYSRMPDALADAAGNAWTKEDWMAAPYSGARLRFDYVGEWIETCDYALPVRNVAYSLDYNGVKKAEYGTDRIRLEALTAEGWREIRTDDVKEEVQSVTCAFPEASGVRRLRFTVCNEGGNPRLPRGIALGKIVITCGEVTESVVRTARATPEERTYAADALTEGGRYRVRVAPLPSEGADLSAETDVIDLSEAVERVIGAVSLRSLENGVYAQSFDALAAVTKAVPFKDLAFPYWQMCYGGETVETVRFSALGGNPSSGGVYVCCDAQKTLASYGLGSLATKTTESVYGLVFSNDCATALADFSLSFTARQRTFKAAPKSLALEYLVTNEWVSVAAEGAWRPLDIPVTAPYTEATRGDRTEYAQEIALDAVPAAVPPGSVLAIRWRDPAMTGGPLTNIDEVRFTAAFVPAPTLLLMR